MNYPTLPKKASRQGTPRCRVLVDFDLYTSTPFPLFSNPSLPPSSTVFRASERMVGSNHKPCAPAMTTTRKSTCHEDRVPCESEGFSMVKPKNCHGRGARWHVGHTIIPTGSRQSWTGSGSHGGPGGKPISPRCRTARGFGVRLEARPADARPGGARCAACNTTLRVEDGRVRLRNAWKKESEQSFNALKIH